MVNEKMTIHKALAELKVIDSRIEKAMNNACFVAAYKKNATKISGVDTNEVVKDAFAAYDQINSLINRRNAIKAAVVLSNATTKINISGKEYTVAEAIDLKNIGMEYKKILKTKMLAQFGSATREIARNSGETIEEKANQYVLSIIQAQPKESKMSVETEEIQNLRKAFIENNSYELLDPIGIKEEIGKLEKEYEDFMTEVDAALSVSNAVTTIDVEY